MRTKKKENIEIIEGVEGAPSRQDRKNIVNAILVSNDESEGVDLGVNYVQGKKRDVFGNTSVTHKPMTKKELGEVAAATKSGGTKATSGANKLKDTTWITYREDNVNLELLEQALKNLSKEGFGYFCAVSAVDFGLFLGVEIAKLAGEYKDNPGIIYQMTPTKYYGKYPEYTRIKDLVDKWFNAIEIKTGGQEYFGLLKYYASIEIPGDSVLKWINNNYIGDTGLEYIVKINHGWSEERDRVSKLVIEREEENNFWFVDK